MKISTVMEEVAACFFLWLFCDVGVLVLTMSRIQAALCCLSQALRDGATGFKQRCVVCCRRCLMEINKREERGESSCFLLSFFWTYVRAYVCCAHAYACGSYLRLPKDRSDNRER